nr:Calx-beta domain-containing protein [Solirubrobacter phytolaccae]
MGDACLELITERDLSLKVEADDPDPAIGRPVTLTATLHNDFPLPATGLRVRVPVPEGWTLASAEASAGTYADGVWSVESLAKRSSATLALKAVPGTEGARALKAEIEHADQADPDSTPGNDGDFEDDRVVLDFDPLPTEIVVGVADARVQEGNRAAVKARVKLTLPRTWRRPVTVRYATVPGTATADDFTAAEGAVRIEPGQQSAAIDVSVRGDRLVEETERFTLALTAEGGTLARTAAEVVIADDDAPAQPGQLDYLGCVSEDRGPLSACQNTAPGLGEPTTVLSPDDRFLYVIGEDRLVVLEHGETPAVRQCIALLERIAGCEGRMRSRVWIVASTFSPDGRFLYLLTRHAGTGRATGLQVHERDPQTGKLTQVACYNGISSCPGLDAIDNLDRVTEGRTELRADGSQLLAVPDAEDGATGRIVTFARAGDGTLSDDRCYDEGEFAEAPCLPLNASWGNDAEAAFGSGPGWKWLVRTDAGLMALQRDDDGRLWPTACAACATDFGGAGDVEVTPEAVYVSGEDRVAVLSHELGVREGCVQDAGLAETACPVRVEALGGLRGLQLSPDGKDLYAGARGGGVLALHRGVGGALTGGECVIAETETSRCGDGNAGGGFAFRAGEVWTARDGVLARFVRFSERGPENRRPVCAGGTAYAKPGGGVDVALRCSDPDGDGVTVEVTGPPKLGQLTVDADGAGRYAAGAVRGEDAIRFRASDGHDRSDEAVLTVKVDDLAPVCRSRRSDYRVPFQTEARLECADPEGGPVTTQIVTPPDRGTLTGTTFSYAEPASAEITLTYTGTDEGGNVSAPATETFVMTYVAPPPPAPTPGPSRPNRGNDRPRTTCRSNCEPDPRGYVPVTITCPRDASNACTGDVQICDPKGCRKVGKTSAVLGRSSFKLQPGKSKTVKVKLGKAMRSKLKKQRKLKVQLVVTLRPPGAKPLVTTTRVTLRAPRSPARAKR